MNRVDPPISYRYIWHRPVAQMEGDAADSNFIISSPCPHPKCVRTVPSIGPPDTWLSAVPPSPPQLFGAFATGADFGSKAVEGD